MGSSQDVGDFSTSSGPEQRCSVGSSLRCQPTPSTREQRSAQDFTFEALHQVYFYDAWRVQPVLDAPESDLVLPPKPGLLEHGCHWPRPNLTPEVLSISDRVQKRGQEVQEGQSLSSLAVTDAAMAEEDANEAVSIHSSSSESPTIPSTEQPEDDDAHMADDASASTSSAEEGGDCLSNRQALSDACPAQDEMLEAEDDAGSELPPQDVDPPCLHIGRSMAPVDEAWACGNPLILSNGGGAYLPSISHSAAQHGILNSN